ncbi:hypothetical protein HYX70_02850 [Candidatus Saccharibacteria bacterium]|nr:hypothetical protein [Candidatus Saccharibacteria bacterium]
MPDKPIPRPPSDEEMGRADLRIDQSNRQAVVLARIAELQKYGFSQEFVNDFRAETLVGANVSVGERLDSLTSQGFHSPVSLIEKQPNILKYAPESIQGKLDSLTSQGFHSPVSLIEKQPSILGLAPGNIQKRVVLFSKLVGLFNSPINPVKLMEQEAGLFSTKIDKLLVLTRIARNSTADASQVDRKLIHDIMFANLEDVLLGLEDLGEEQQNANPNYTIQQLLARAKEIKKQSLGKNTKRARIERAAELDPKVKARYFKGYPLKSALEQKDE